MKPQENYFEYFCNKSNNDLESLSSNIKTTISLSSTLKESEQANTFLLSKVSALDDISIFDDLSDYPSLPSSPQSTECPNSPLIKFKDNNFEGSSFSLN